MKKCNDLEEENIVKKVNQITNPFEYNIGINEKSSNKDKNKIDEFDLNELFVIKKR